MTGHNHNLTDRDVRYKIDARTKKGNKHTGKPGLYHAGRQRLDDINV